jgi:hypothetical protein
MFCVNCGEEAGSEVKFCGYCGKPIGANPTTNDETPVAQPVQTRTHAPQQMQQPYQPVNHHRKPPLPVKKILDIAIPIAIFSVILVTWMIYSSSNLPPTGGTPSGSGQIDNRGGERDSSVEGNNNDDNNLQPEKSSYLGKPITLEEAQKTPGLYIKDGDMFIFVKPQWEYSIYDSHRFTSRALGEEILSIKGIDHDCTSASVVFPILCDDSYIMPRLLNNTKLALVGITHLAIYEVVDTGWTIPVGLALWDETRNNAGGWWSNAQNKLLEYGWHNAGLFTSYYDQVFEEINGVAPTNYVSRMIYTGYRFNLASTHGILSATQGEDFTFAWMDGTTWVESTYTADKRFFLLPVDDSVATQANYEIVETQNGYFEVRFLTPPDGYYAIGTYRSSFNKIVEFVSP